MPEMDGYELLHALRERALDGAAFRAVALTAHAREEDRRRAVLEGYEGYLSKPVSAVELIQVLTGLAPLTGAGSSTE